MTRMTRMTRHRHCLLLGASLLFTVTVASQEGLQIRLMDGRSRCEGRVEILHQGSWGTICHENWGIRDASVVCRQLSCGKAHYVTKIESFGVGSGPIWLTALRCTGKESHIWNCPSQGWGPHNCSHWQDVGVVCSGFVRLDGGNGYCSGRVEVNAGESWTAVSDGNFTLPTAQVICEELRCGRAVSVLRNVSKKDNVPVWAEEFQCAGQESELWLCPRVPLSEGSCHHSGAVGIVCSENPKIRLMDGNTRCTGRVEIFHQDSWGTICQKYWDLNDAHVVCRQLGCGVALEAVGSAYFKQGSGPIWLSDLKCRGGESHIWKCPSTGWGKSYCSHKRDAGVICSGFVRLVGGKGPCSGRVEVNPGGGWTAVSDRNFTLLTAQVVCAELGCGRAVSVQGRAGSGGDGACAAAFRCAGHERALRLCPLAAGPGGDCGRGGTVEVGCSEHTEVRLVRSGAAQCEGQVELKTPEGWRPLCASDWDVADAAVVCRQLGCGLAVSAPRGAFFVDRGGEALRDRFHCSGGEAFLWACPTTALGLPACARGDTASAVCSGNQTQLRPQGSNSLCDPAGSAASQGCDANCSGTRQLRLVDGDSRCAGRVEILQQGSWGTICDDSWDLNDAHVVCKQLGCGVALHAMGSAHFGAGSGPIWLDDLNCTGEESHIWKCPSQGWGQHDCQHKEDSGVICSEFLALRILSEDQECAGWLEVFYNQTWGSVCRSPMDTVTLSVICRQLGCGDTGTLNSSAVIREGFRPRWVDGIQCRKSDTSLWQCPSDPWSYRSCSVKDEAYITCAGVSPKSCPVAAPCTDKEKLRLRGGDNECSGRVEVWHEGTWGTVCDDSWDLAEAEVVCQQLACGSALDAPGEAAFGPGNGSIWLDEVQCKGRESSLWGCAAAPWGQNDCKHEEDAGVICSGTSSGSASVPGIISLPVILCITLGTSLLFMILILLGTQLSRWRAECQALPAFEDAAAEALYQEVYYTVRLKDLLDKQETPGQHADATGNDYDDVGDLPVSEIPSSLGKSEKYLFPEEEGGAMTAACSVSGSLTCHERKAANSIIDDEVASLIPGKEKPEHDTGPN